MWSQDTMAMISDGLEKALREAIAAHKPADSV